MEPDKDRQPSPDIGHEMEKEELKVLLGSRSFVRSPRLAQLLNYLCQKYFSGTAAELKEYTIAVEHFERAANFQSKTDPIVRVDANRLRQKLKRYYRTEGKEHPVQIGIPPGQYAPVFERKLTQETSGTETAEASDSAADSTPSPELPEEQLAHAELPTGWPVAPVAASVQPQARFLRIAVFPFLVLVILTLAALLFFREGGRGATVQTAPPITASPELMGNPRQMAAELGDEVRILAGSAVDKCVDRQGKVWTADRFFTGGEVYSPLPMAMLRAEESIFCRTARVGDFRYDIPLNPGVYEVHLYFAELRYGREPEEGGESTRRFNVFLNDRMALREFDIVSDIGGTGLVDSKVFTDVSPGEDGFLHIVFHSLANGALLSGIEILPGIPGKMRPVRLAARTTPHIAADGAVWEPDNFFRGGRHVNRLSYRVTNTDEPELFAGERFGHFAYKIPVIPGRYKVTLWFAETYFGYRNFRSSALGMRLFTVYCNGQTLLKNFDITKEAGGDERAVKKVFEGIESDPQDKIALTFIPVKNYACVNAIEVVAQ